MTFIQDRWLKDLYPVPVTLQAFQVHESFPSLPEQPQLKGFSEHVQNEAPVWGGKRFPLALSFPLPPFYTATIRPSKRVPLSTCRVVSPGTIWDPQATRERERESSRTHIRAAPAPRQADGTQSVSRYSREEGGAIRKEEIDPPLKPLPFSGRPGFAGAWEADSPVLKTVHHMHTPDSTPDSTRVPRLMGSPSHLPTGRRKW